MEPPPVRSVSVAGATLPPGVAPAISRQMEASWFFVGMALLAAASVVAGFLPTYFVPLAAGTLDIPALVHLHGVLFFAWTLLFAVQPLLVRAGRVRLHRRLGVAGAVLAAVMVVAGVVVAFGSSARSVATGQAEAGQAFLLITLTDMLLFGVFAGAAIHHRRRVQTHRRLMLLATAALLPAAFGRLAFFGFGIEHPLAMHLGAASFLFAGAGFDLWRRGRVHPAYLWGGGFLLAVYGLRMLFAESAAWLAVAGWILGLIQGGR